MLLTEKRIAGGADGAPVHLLRWEPDRDTLGVLQIVHGFGESAGRYTRWARRFTERRWAVYAHDLRGHGATPGKRGVADFKTLLSDIDAVRDRIRVEQPGLPVALYGHSMGGTQVLRRLLEGTLYTDDYERAVVTGPWLAAYRSYPERLLPLARVLARVMPGFTLHAALRPAALSADTGHLAKTLEDGTWHNHLGARLLTDALEAGQYILAHAAELRLPLLLLQGEQDRLVSPDAARAFARAAGAAVSLKLYPQRHELHNDERRDEIFHDIMAFLDAQTP